MLNIITIFLATNNYVYDLHDSHINYDNYEVTHKMHLLQEQLNKLNCIHNKPECNMFADGVPCFPETIPPIVADAVAFDHLQNTKIKELS